MEIIDNINEFIKTLLLNLGLFGPILACILIVIESIIPILPLFLFISLNFIYFGKIIGFLISWVFTIIGCYISYIICKKGLSNWFGNKIKDRSKLENLMYRFSNISIGGLIAIIAIPFTPAFLVNIAAGLSNMQKRKFLLATIIGKIVCVYFWGYIGISLVECLENPLVLIKIGLLVVGAYLVGKIINKVLKID